MAHKFSLHFEDIYLLRKEHILGLKELGIGLAVLIGIASMGA